MKINVNALSCACLMAALLGYGASPGSAQPALGPLKVHAKNPRYFDDGTGKAVYLTGSHIWNNFIDWGPSDPPPEYDHANFVRWLKEHNHNFTRGWVWENTQFPNHSPAWTCRPLPWERTGPGMANDGKPKFDLTKVSSEYLKRLRDRTVAYRDAGIYVGIMLFQPINYGTKRGEKPRLEEQAWYTHPLHRNNNINGLDGDPNNDGEGWEAQTLSTDKFYDPPVDPAVTAMQERYIEAMIDALHDMDNILWEIGNEGLLKSDAWQDHLIRHIQEYEKKKGYPRHLVWKTAMDELRQTQHVNARLFRSPAEVISPNRQSMGDYRGNPPAAAGKKIIMPDTDHLWGVGGDVPWVWKTFTRGNHPIFMDPNFRAPWGNRWASADYEPVRRAMGHTLAYARRMNLAAVMPQAADSATPCSTRYCLFSPGGEYLAYQPDTGRFKLDLPAGRYECEWFNVGTGKVVGTGITTAAGGLLDLVPPFDGQAVVLLRRLGPASQAAAPKEG